jgi:hypothetical protein
MPLKPAPVASVQRPIRESGARSRRADGCNGGRTCPTRRTSDFGRAMRARVALGRRLASGRGRLEQLLTPTVGTCSSPCAPSDSVQGPTSEGVVLGAPAWTSAVPVANASSARGRDRDDSEAAWASAASVRARAPASRDRGPRPACTGVAVIPDFAAGCVGTRSRWRRRALPAAASAREGLGTRRGFPSRSSTRHGRAQRGLWRAAAEGEPRRKPA